MEPNYVNTARASDFKGIMQYLKKNQPAIQTPEPFKKTIANNR